MPHGPIYALRFVHAAIRRATSDLAARAAELSSPGEAAALESDFDLLAMALRGHAIGEDEGYFGTLDERAPGMTAAFTAEHADESERLDVIGGLVRACDSDGALDRLRSELAELRDHAEQHMSREEANLWPKTEELFTPPEQGAIIGAILAVIPKSDFPALIPWIVARNTDDEAEAYVRMLQHVQPPEVFAMTRSWLASGLAADQWSMLCGRIEGLA